MTAAEQGVAAPRSDYDPPRPDYDPDLPVLTTSVEKMVQ
jgi:hypothetical protein